MCTRNKKDITTEYLNSKKIDRELKQESTTLQPLKLLLLGSGECGKSTIFKQIISFQDEATKKEYTPPSDYVIKNIFLNILTATSTFVRVAPSYNIEFSEEENQKIQSILNVFSDLENLDQTVFTSVSDNIKYLWNSKQIQSIYNNTNRIFQLNDSTEYLMSNIDRYSKPFKPTQNDFLRVRVKTTGIVEADFKIEAVPFKLVDVGGQKNQRRKWIHCFQDITCVLFVTSINDYDTLLEEDNSTSRFTDSLELFREMVNSNWFTKSPFVLFFNKIDLFKEKIKRIPVSQHLKDFNGNDHSYEETSQFIKNKFHTTIKNSNKIVYHHFTCALDSRAIEVVFNSIQHSLLMNVAEIL
ncbi:G-protein subunit alpha 12 [Dictyostelium discoideum AX4]|uniref:Guanine nucleotide-binding protein alpha-12 subunit n=1 Tax=Dictyostelium discoideum TaxID=44689 RepID=GPA12_DICDI|nr:G-protein subunit alpha 12 [Dictyostelium discoideum AX4]Q54VG1.1 RecName: Full=Guanine nucleotide-binding protein alpha-12 subunit; Short=G alpha-12 [Dictyostelium discoideum]EAL67402.1 G-protein subunit alpha 12 [Dictyostelium discoideum AX4]|eukprot:XP_641394.1 G-protein subunit alpha 12 [Dictyostelium discoideum AX4]